MRFIIVGASPHKSFKKNYIYEEGDYLIGLDEGAKTIINQGYHLSEAWGDFDSGHSFKIIKKKADLIYQYPIDKAETDLELLLKNLTTDVEIYLYDITGGRLDHELVNLMLLAKYKNLNLRIVDELNEVRFYSKKDHYVIEQENYDYVGLLTFSKAQVTIIQGKYPLVKATITPLETYTTSNRFVDGKFIFSLIQGEVLLIRSKAKA